MTRFTILTLHIVGALVGCNGEVQIVVAPPELPPDAAPALEACATPILVPEGNAWIGGLQWVDGQITPFSCDEAHGYGSTNVVVPNVFLDQTEVTNACYRQCVDAGACSPPLPVPQKGDEPWPSWDEPTMQDVPTQLLDGARAEAFCRWRGGRVPSMAELNRAEHGNALSIFNPNLQELWLQCAEGKPTPCAPTNRPNNWPAPTQSWELDRGPFGHYDVAGSVLELTQTLLPANSEELDAADALCRTTNALDPRTLGTGDRVGFETVHFNLSTPPIEGQAIITTVGEGLGGSPLKGGVRCAYDPL